MRVSLRLPLFTVLAGMLGALSIHIPNSTAQAANGEVFRSPWDQVSDSVISPLAACCETTITDVKASANSAKSRDPILGYACPAGRKAVACFKTILGDRKVERDLFTSLARELPQKAREEIRLTSSCGGQQGDFLAFAQCVDRGLRDPSSEIFKSIRNNGGNTDAVRARLAAWRDQLHLRAASSLACERLQGNVKTRASGAGYQWDREDPECAMSVTPIADMDREEFLPTPRDITDQAVLADEAVQLASRRPDDSSATPESTRPRSSTDPVVDLSAFGIGAIQRSCPKYLPDMGCVPTAGQWAPTTSDDGRIQKINQSFPGLRDLMFAHLGQHAVELLGESYISSLMVLNPENLRKVGRKKESFLQAASCLPADEKARLSKAFEVTAVPGFSDRVAINRARLGRDLKESARKVYEAEKLAQALDAMFQNGGSCGFIAERFNSYQASTECRAFFVELKAAERIRDEGFANYPIFAEDLEGTRVLDRLSVVNSPEQALKIHDQVLERVTDATLRRVEESCADLSAAGKMATLNPIVARSFLEQNPDAGWVFCSAYAENERNEGLKLTARMTFLGASLLVTGGWSGLVFAGLSTGLTLHDIATRHEAATRDRDEYLAGVGNVAAYLDAREALDDFYWGAAMDLGLEGLGLVPELGMLRGWIKADKMARAGKMAFMSAEAEARIAKWYRSRLSQVFGDAARGLSDLEVKSLARLEEAGMDLTGLKGVSCAL